MPRIKLNPCPLCGEPAAMELMQLAVPIVWNVECDRCSLVLLGGNGDSYNDMVRTWNRLTAKDA